jgi:hypothetical protein
LQDTEAGFFSPIFFMIVVFFGAFFLLNLILAVIMESIDKIDKNSSFKQLELKLKTEALTTMKEHILQTK